MIVRVDVGASEAPYEQLRAQVVASIAAGELPPGTRLPPIRQLAGDLGLAPGTVARAYRELEADGLVVSAGRRGTRVAAPPAGSPVPDARVVEAARRFAAEVAPLHLDVEVAVTAVRAALRQQAANGRTT